MDIGWNARRGLAGLALVGIGALAAAQTPPDTGALEEVVVTARKRAETLQDTPLTIQAFTGADIEARGAKSLTDLIKYAPGVTFNAGTSRASGNLSIRGMTQLAAPGDTRKDLVTVFIDGVPYVGSLAGIGSDDLERVEVIKGPQSALFGKATFGGAISMITTTPGQEVKGRVSVTAAAYGDRRVSAALEGPIAGDVLAGRVVVDASSFDGFYKNDLGGRLGASDRRYVSGTLSFTPLEALSIRVRYSDRHDRDGPAAATLIARYADHNCGPFPGFTPRPLAGLPPEITLPLSRTLYCGELRSPGHAGINVATPAQTIAGGLLPFYDHKDLIDHDQGSATADWRFAGGHTLTAIASRQHFNLTGFRDFELAPEDRYQLFYRNRQSQETYELRLTSPAEQRLSWMAGVARLDNTYASLGAFINGTLFGAAAGGPTAAALNLQRSASKTDSVFASLGLKVTDGFDVSVEARRQKDSQTSGVGTPLPFTVETRATLPRVLLRYALSEQTKLYANYAKGNQPTQGYATYFQITPAQQAIAAANGVTALTPEARVNNYELGLKHRSADGRWYLNTSLYYLKWVGRQGTRTVQVDLNGDGIIQTGAAPTGETFNGVPFAAGDSHTTGVEIDGAYRVGEHWTFGGSAAYADGEITKALNEALPLRFFGRTDSPGAEFQGAPKLSGSAYGEYEAAWSSAGTWFVRTDMTYIGKRYDSLLNVAYVPPQFRTHLRAGLRAENWEVTAFVENLFNDRTLESSLYNSDSALDPFFFQLASSEAVLPNKRQVGVTATYRF